MKLLLYALITFATITLGVYLYGHTLAPVRSGTATNACTAPAHVLLATILDVESQPRWRTSIASIQRTGEASSWVEKKSQREEITFKLLDTSQDFVSMSFVSNQGYYGKWRAEFKEHNATGTMITATEEVTVQSPLGRVLSQLFFNPEEFAASYLKELCFEAERRAVNSNK
ncbi:SRPBCC family protein [Limnohabitans sp. 63ED37-2]|uniref:SRPBCC family protein n=1 Tax=Limnohabitans sp. 63ED37-2 TaxID=1678128 RepID=UPI000705C2C9|nr:SRPBCC family protein [Limnohabitans sp. 63ED37-2]ALK88408.1 hypothetical protein L63ED372_01197 [Limnohabitans sp. 63ED37-2]